jgi:hypothetical protein
VEKEMKRIPFLAIVLLAFAFPAHAQDAMKKDAAVKPADPELKVVLDQVPRPYRAPFARMGGDLVFGAFSIQCAPRHMDISAFVPLQDLGFGRHPSRRPVRISR